MAEETYLQQTQQLLPEYQEAFLKSLLFSAFDPYGGYVTDAQGNIQTHPMKHPTAAQRSGQKIAPTGFSCDRPKKPR